MQAGAGRAAGWREVREDRFGRDRGLHYVVLPATVVWLTDDDVVGIFAIAPQTVSDLDDSWRVFRVLCDARPGMLRVFADARNFRTAGAPAAVMKHLLTAGPREVAVLRTRIDRAATILPHDWLRPWWKGALDAEIWGPFRALATDDVEVAWCALDVPPATGEAVAALTAAFSTDDQLRARAEAHVEEAPALDLAGVARRLGMSARAFQRALSRTGETFAAMRERVRLRQAMDGIAASDEKIESVAASVGFRSRSHFVTWFRERVGVSPTAFRESRRRSAE